MNKLTLEQKLSRGRMAIMNHEKWALYSGLLMVGTMTITEQGITACTNGRDVIFGREFGDSLSDAELRFLILHENEHKALRQLTTYAFLAKENPKLTNVAMDFVVNGRLMSFDAGEGFIEMPSGACYDPKYLGWDTKRVYDDLKQNNPPSGKPKAGQGQPGSGQGDEPAPLDEHDFEGAAELSKEEQEALKEEIEDAIRQGGLLAGNKAGGSKNHLDEVLTSQIRWQEILAEFIKSTTKGRDNSTWSKLNRRYLSSGLYLPSAIAETVGGLLIAGDASGSTWSGNQLAGFLGEAKAIIQDVVPEFVDFIWWDTKVQKVWHFEPQDYDGMIEEIKAIQGGGGTAPSCITRWVKEEEKQYVAAIVLSDGQVGNDWGRWDNIGEAGGALPVLFCLNTKGITAPVGSTLYIEAEY